MVDAHIEGVAELGLWRESRQSCLCVPEFVGVGYSENKFLPSSLTTNGLVFPSKEPAGIVCPTAVAATRFSCAAVGTVEVYVFWAYTWRNPS